VGRDPYAAHLCAHDPTAWQQGFNFAGYWVDHLACSGATPAGIYQAIRHSTGVPFPVTAAAVNLPPDAKTEGFMLGVYGHVALVR
jgi:hypothetical protein